jgi:hypothetical protein
MRIFAVVCCTSQRAGITYSVHAYRYNLKVAFS